MHERLFEAEGLSRTFDRGRSTVKALTDLSCQVVADDRIALVGPSGSGKTTLLNLIAGLDRPTTGRLAWPALGPPDSLQPAKVGVMFQSRSLMPALTCLENVELPLLLDGRNTSARELAMNALSWFRVNHIAEQLPAEISGGQAQRVALARAVVASPRLVLADEPTGQLDRRTGAETIDSLLEWLEGNCALIVATHDDAVARRMKHVWRIEHGVMAGSIECSTA